MNDRELRQDVLDELDFVPTVNAKNVGVAVSSGVVTLTGHVRTHAEKSAAERAVRRVEGVRAIVEEMEVVSSDHVPPTDDELAQRALNAVSPLATLARGFAIVTRAGGELLRDARAVDPGAQIEARLARGTLTARVTGRRDAE